MILPEYRNRQAHILSSHSRTTPATYPVCTEIVHSFATLEQNAAGRLTSLIAFASSL
jgi:hypothetical protein